MCSLHLYTLFYYKFQYFSFYIFHSTFLPSVLWCCWLGGRKGIQPVKNWVVGCWHGYLSGGDADLHMAQLMPMPVTISCSSKSRLVLPSWFLADCTIGRTFGTLCFGTLCLSVCRLWRFCIVAKRYILAKNCLKEWIGNQDQKVNFWGRRHISTSGFASTATETAILPYFCPYNRY